MDDSAFIPLHLTYVNAAEFLAETFAVGRRHAASREVTLHISPAREMPEAFSVDVTSLRFALAVVIKRVIDWARAGGRQLPGGIVDIHVGYDAVIDEIEVKIVVPERRKVSHVDDDAFAIAQAIVRAHRGRVVAIEEQGVLSATFCAGSWQDE